MTVSFDLTFLLYSLILYSGIIKKKVVTLKQTSKYVHIAIHQLTLYPFYKKNVRIRVIAV